MCFAVIRTEKISDIGRKEWFALAIDAGRNSYRILLFKGRSDVLYSIWVEEWTGIELVVSCRLRFLVELLASLLKILALSIRWLDFNNGRFWAGYHISWCCRHWCPLHSYVLQSDARASSVFILRSSHIV